MKGPGSLIALSGVDCAGKSTQRALLLEALRARGLAPATVWSRAGYTPNLNAAKRVVRVLLGPLAPSYRPGARGSAVPAQPGRYPRRASNLRQPLRWLWLTGALLDLLWVYGVRVRVWRARGRVVVCDRHLLDCLVDLRVNFPEEGVERRWLFRALRRLAARPDAAFCLVVPAELSFERARTKGRRHGETREVLERRVAEYERAAAELGVPVLDGRRPAAELARAIQQGLGLAAPHTADELRGLAERAEPGRPASEPTARG